MQIFEYMVLDRMRLAVTVDMAAKWGTFLQLNNEMETSLRCIEYVVIEELWRMACSSSE